MGGGKGGGEVFVYTTGGASVSWIWTPDGEMGYWNGESIAFLRVFWMPSNLKMIDI